MVATTATRSKPKSTTPRLPKPTQKPRPTTPKPAAYRPRIQFVSADEYALPSESYSGHILYLVTVIGPRPSAFDCTTDTNVSKIARYTVQATAHGG